ncbi:MAG: hypothetical protein PVJ57_18690 [Phycisphaerae bacterium]|jgi:hypothetical protein
MAKSSRKKTAAEKQAPKRLLKRTRASRRVKSPAGKCFVMMPFREPFDTYFTTIILPAITKANFEATRADDLFRPSVIVADMWKMIQDAKVLLAELTTKNANVFYELGLAHAIGKPVVLVSEKMEDVPFDLQQLRVLLYDKNDPAWGVKLREDISSSLAEVAADPIEAVPQTFRKKVASKAPVDTIESRLSQMERRIIRLERGDREPSTLPVVERSRAGLELRGVNDESELEAWFTKWAARLPRSVFERILVNDGQHVPSDDMARCVAKHLG